MVDTRWLPLAGVYNSSSPKWISNVLCLVKRKSRFEISHWGFVLIIDITYLFDLASYLLHHGYKCSKNILDDEVQPTNVTNYIA